MAKSIVGCIRNSVARAGTVPLVPCAGTARAPPVLWPVLAPQDNTDPEGLERVQGRERSWEGAGEPQERLRELGKGLSLEQRRLRGDLVALHKPLTGGGRDRRRGNGLKWHQGRLRLEIFQTIFPCQSGEALG